MIDPDILRWEDDGGPFDPAEFLKFMDGTEGGDVLPDDDPSLPCCDGDCGSLHDPILGLC